MVCLAQDELTFTLLICYKNKVGCPGEKIKYHCTVCKQESRQIAPNSSISLLKDASVPACLNWLVKIVLL